MRWSKRGLVFRPTGRGWMTTHAQNPFPEPLGGGRYRVHFAARDAANRARGGFFEIDVDAPAHALSAAESPSLDLGELGCFDDCGAMPSCLVDVGGEKYLYYTGWTQHVATPFSFFIGLAISRDGGRTYRRHSRAPVLGRTCHDPYLTASPWVLLEGGRWRMWYVSGTRWERDEATQRLRHYYHIRYAESGDGIRWEGDGTVAIDYTGDEYAIARPVVVKQGGSYLMWYCHRGGERAYRAGYAESPDGRSWQRKDHEAGIDVSGSGWDSEMICYPCAFDHDGRWLLLYNGNGYGRDGVGLAVGEP